MLFAGCVPKNYDYLQKYDLPQTNRIVLNIYPQEEYYCAPSSIATILEYEKITFNYNDLVKKTFTPKLKGTLQPELKATFRSHGLIPYELDGELKSILTELSNTPVIVLFNLGLDGLPKWHYSVLTGYDMGSKKIFMSAPNGSETWMSFEEFERFFEKGGKWAIAPIKPPKLPNSSGEKEVLSAIADMYEVGKKEEAKSAATAWLSKNPNSILAITALGNMYFEDGDYRNATSIYKEALLINEKDPIILNNIAIALLRQNRAKEAKKYAKKAVAIGGIFLQKYQNTLFEIEQAIKENK